MFVCSNCGQDFSKWLGRCTNCGAWDTITEMRGVKATPSFAPPRPESDRRSWSSLIAKRRVGRVTSAFPEIDRVLGGGLIPGALILLGGDPGIGKSTLLLQLLSSWAKQGKQGAVHFGRGINRADLSAGKPPRVADAAHPLLTELHGSLMEKLEELTPASW